MEAKKLSNKGLVLLLDEREANWLHALFGLTLTSDMDTHLTRGLAAYLGDRTKYEPLPECFNGKWVAPDVPLETRGFHESIAFRLYDVINDALETRGDTNHE